MRSETTTVLAVFCLAWGSHAPGLCAAAESHCSAPPAARLVTRHQYIIRNESDVDVPVEQPLQVIEPGQCNPGAREGRHGASSQ